MDCAYLEFTYIPGFTVTYAVSSTSNQVITNLSPTESFLIITCSIFILLHHHEFISLLLWLPLLFFSNVLFSIFSDKQRKAAFPHIWEQIFDILPLKVNWCKWSGWFTTLVFNVPNLTFCTFSSITHKGPFLQTFILSYQWVIWSIHPQWFNTSLFVFAAFPSCGWFSCTLRQNAFVEKRLLAAENTVDWFTEFYALVFAHTCVCKREFGALCIIMECHERMSLPLTDNGWLLRWTRTFYAHSERRTSILYVADNTHSAGIVLYTDTHICWAAFLLLLHSLPDGEFTVCSWIISKPSEMLIAASVIPSTYLITVTGTGTQSHTTLSDYQ